MGLQASSATLEKKKKKTGEKRINQSSAQDTLSTKVACSVLLEITASISLSERLPLRIRKV